MNEATNGKGITPGKAVIDIGSYRGGNVMSSTLNRTLYRQQKSMW